MQKQKKFLKCENIPAEPNVGETFRWRLGKENMGEGWITGRKEVLK